MKRKLALFALSALVLALPAAAQGIYRCGNSYSHQPCPNGSEVQAPPAPSAEEQARSREGARQDAKTANAMEKARLKEEDKPVPVYIPPAKSEAGPEPETPTVTKLKKKSPYFTAVAPGEKKKKKDDKRSAEK